MSHSALPLASIPAPVDDFSSLARTRPRYLSGDALLAFLCRGAACAIVFMLLALIYVLAVASIPAIQTFGLSFLTSTEWRANELEVPVRDERGKIVYEDGEVLTRTIAPVFGAAPVIWGTAVSSVLALGFAIPLSFGAALFLVRIAPGSLRPVASFLIEFLAAIPSIAYGIWGLFVLVPFLQRYAEPALVSVLSRIPGLKFMVQNADGNALALTGRDMFAGGLILGIMILPIITAISRDVLSAVPRAQIEGTLALGATWWQSARQMLSYARAGLFGAVMLGLARAAGETMAVTMVIGNSTQIALSPFAPAQTMSSLLANQFAEASPGTHRAALTEVALILLLMSLLFNVVARYLVVGKNARSAAH